MQKIISPANNYEELNSYLKDAGCRNILLVCGKSFDTLLDREFADFFDFSYVRFSEFSPNPLYEQCMDGVRVFKENGCDTILAVGGGSAIDVAKCIRFFAGEKNRDISDTPLIAIPTTAGTGSESTTFAVMYKDGKKQSVEDVLCYPDAYVLDGRLLLGLPILQRKTTLLDVLCHSIESLWSLKATDESRDFAKKALSLIDESWEGYLNNIPLDNEKMLTASNLSGKAINISKTTAAHAMCYKITSLYGIPHGQAAAMCLKELLPYTLKRIEIEKELKGYLLDLFNRVYDKTKPSKVRPKTTDIKTLAESVNIQRLSNHPVKLDEKIIPQIYKQMFGFS